MAEEGFGRHDHHRLLEAAPHLAAQAVKKIGRSRQVGDLHVIFGAELEKTLEPRRAVFRSLAFVAVGQEQDDAAGALPL
jgi:hypothetical protein